MRRREHTISSTTAPSEHFLGSKTNNNNIATDIHAALMLMSTNPFEPHTDEAATGPKTQLKWTSATGEEL